MNTFNTMPFASTSFVSDPITAYLQQLKLQELSGYGTSLPNYLSSNLNQGLGMNPYVGFGHPNIGSFSTGPLANQYYQGTFGMGAPYGTHSLNQFGMNIATNPIAVNAIANKIRNDWVTEEQIKQIGSKLVEPRNVDQIASLVARGTIPTQHQLIQSVVMDRSKDMLLNGLLNHVVEERRARRNFGLQEVAQHLGMHAGGFGGMGCGAPGAIAQPNVFNQAAWCNPSSGIANACQMTNWM